MSEKSDRERRLPRWYFGGLASAGAACCTHPLDLIKVHLQTQQEGKTSIIKLTKNIIKKEGITGLDFLIHTVHYIFKIFICIILK